MPERSKISRRHLLKGAAGVVAGAAAIAPLRARSDAQVDPSAWTRESDVVVVGLGAAGACTALEARAAGAEVLVLEGAAAGGGSTRFSAGEIYLGGGTPLQKALGFEDDVEEMIRYLLASSGDGADAARIRLYCEASLEHFGWLRAQGLVFNEAFYPEHHDSPGAQGLRWAASENAHPFDTLARPAPRAHKMNHAGMAGSALMDLLIARVKAAGAEIATETRCEALVEDETGRVVGVEIESKGVRSRIRARGGVVLCTGGFIFNPEMLAVFAPGLLGTSPIGAPTDDGSGIRMGIGLGAAAVHMDAGFVGLALHPPEEIIQGVLVDRRGQRFINEDCYLGRVGEYAMARAEGDVHLILDAGVRASPVLGDNELVAEADDIEALHAKLGLPALLETLTFYNRHAVRREDPLFEKKPEFVRPLVKALRAYHYRVGAAFFPAFTLGGLRTRPTGEVLRPDGDAIAGLYAAGRAASGIPARAYNTGTSIGDATYFGRLAGRSAAALARD